MDNIRNEKNSDLTVTASLPREELMRLAHTRREEFCQAVARRAVHEACLQIDLAGE
jgi:hypothetical protein